MEVLPANLYFDADMLQILAQPSAWRLVSSLAPPDVEAVKRAPRRRVQWSEARAHAHPHAEFLVALRGHGVYGHAGAIYACAPGTAFFFRPGEPHDSGYPPQAASADHLWISLLHDRVVAFLIAVRADGWSAGGRFRALLTAESTGIVPAAFLALAQGLPEALPPAWGRMRCLAALQAIVVKLVEQGFHGVTAADPQEASRQEVIDAVCDHIRRTAGRGITLDHLARLAGYSKYHFVRLFRRCTGRTVLAYINECRQERVRSMLAQNCSHKQIGAALGFSCPAAFSRWFRQHMRAF